MMYVFPLKVGFILLTPFVIHLIGAEQLLGWQCSALIISALAVLLAVLSRALITHR
jgi:hypothetical protein